MIFVWFLNIIYTSFGLVLLFGYNLPSKAVTSVPFEGIIYKEVTSFRKDDLCLHFSFEYLLSPNFKHTPNSNIVLRYFEMYSWFRAAFSEFGMSVGLSQDC
jgi:hypothetical protein